MQNLFLFPRTIIFPTLLLLFSLLGFSVTAQAERIKFLDRIVAVVNDDVIMETELREEIAAVLKRLEKQDITLPPLQDLTRQVLEQIVLDRLRYQDAKAAGMEATEAMVDQALQRIAKSSGVNLVILKQRLEQQGTPYATLREDVKRQLTMERFKEQRLQRRIRLTKDEVDHAVKQLENSINAFKEYKLGHILISFPESATSTYFSKTKQKAAVAEKELRSGVAFEQVAMKYSSGTHALQGGKWPWKRAEELPSLFTKHLPRVEKESFVGPLRDQYGFHFLKLLDVRHISNQSGEEISKKVIRSRAEQLLYQRKLGEETEAWVRRIRNEAFVQYHLNESDY